MVDPDDQGKLPRELLASWTTPEPQAGFVERVARRIESERAPSPRRRWPLVAAFAGGMAAAAIIAVLGWGRGVDRLTEPAATVAIDHAPSKVEARRSFAIGPHATAVAEAGAELGWHADADRTRISQRQGSVFYRVEPTTSPFEVVTAHGTVRVVGTCFTVTVEPRATTVQVHEGEVVLESTGGSRRLVPGEIWAVGRAGAIPVARTPSTDGPPRDGCPPVPDCEPETCECSTEGDDTAWPGFPLPPATLRSYLEICRVFLDAPPLDAQDALAATVFLTALDLEPAEGAAVRLALERSQAELRAALDQEYSAATGESAEGLALEFVLTGLRATTSELEEAQARLRVAEARAAGESIEPRPDASPYEQAYRAIHGFGDAFERELSTRLGAGRARELRVLRGGWDGDRLEESGCP